jgi:hypothetical protein
MHYARVISGTNYTAGPDKMTRRSSKQNQYRDAQERADRIAKLIAEGWITDAIEIPATAIPVDPHRINIGGSYFRPTYFEDKAFVCQDCGSHQLWKAEDQIWFYETSGAPYYSTAIRCRSCRAAERTRKIVARRAAGHDKNNAKQDAPSNGG